MLCADAGCPCQGTPLASDDIGQRQVIWESLPTYTTTCRSSAVLGTTAKCQWLTYTGVKSPSSCGETWCYAQVCNMLACLQCVFLCRLCLWVSARAGPSLAAHN